MSSEMMRVTYVKSAIGYNQRQKDTVRSLGLRKLGESALVPDNAATRGMVAAVAHLVRAESVAEAQVSTSDA